MEPNKNLEEELKALQELVKDFLQAAAKYGLTDYIDDDLAFYDEFLETFYALQKALK